MAKSRKEILLELLQLEGEDLGNIGKTNVTIEEPKEENNETINEVKEEQKKTSLTKPKKQLSEKQLETLKKGQEIRNANRVKRAEEKRIKEEQDKKELEEKLVKKAIALKKKQLKQQQILDEITDDENENKDEIKSNPIKTNIPLAKPKPMSIEENKPIKPAFTIKFF